MAQEIAPRVVVDPQIRSGKPIIKGTRVPVELVVAKLAGGMSAEDVAEEYEITMADIYADPHYAARGMLVRVPEPELGSVTLPAPVPRLSDTPGRIRHAAGRVGTDTERILQELAGLSHDEIARLEADHVIHCGASEE